MQAETHVHQESRDHQLASIHADSRSAPGSSPVEALGACVLAEAKRRCAAARAAGMPVEARE